MLMRCVCTWCDRSVLAWRKWYHKQGQGGFWKAAGRPATPAPELTREQLLDRFHQHTKQCPSCSKVTRCSMLIYAHPCIQMLSHSCVYCNWAGRVLLFCSLFNAEHYCIERAQVYLFNMKQMASCHLWL
jgi:hypothetical protein